MHWFSWRTLHTLRGGAKLVAASCTFVLGFITKRVVDKLTGPSAVDPQTFLTQCFDHPWLLAGTAGILAALAASKLADVLWLDRLTRDAAIIGTSMRYLYTRVFGSEPGHRITFMAKRFPFSRHIRPRYRYAYGHGFQINSQARFSRGMALAGLAWARPGGHATFTEPDIPAFAQEADFFSFAETRFKIPRKEAKRLSNDTKHARWIFAYGIVHPLSHQCIGVLCIDSTEPDAFRKLDLEQVLVVASIVASLVKK